MEDVTHFADVTETNDVMLFTELGRNVLRLQKAVEIYMRAAFTLKLGRAEATVAIRSTIGSREQPRADDPLHVPVSAEIPNTVCRL